MMHTPQTPINAATSDSHPFKDASMPRYRESQRASVDPSYARGYIEKWRDAAEAYIAEVLDEENGKAARAAVDHVVSSRLAPSLEKNKGPVALLASSQQILGKKGELTRAIADAIHGVAGGDVAIIQRSLIEQVIGALSRESWVPVEERHPTKLGSRTDALTGVEEYDGGVYHSRIVPLNGAFAVEFAGADAFLRYGTRGVPSAALKMHPVAALEGAPRLANGWVTTLTNPEGEVIFEGIRSASLVHYGIKDPEVRREATIAAAEELLQAATVLAVARQDAGASAEAIAGEPLHIKLASFELQTRPESDRDDPTAQKFAIERLTVDEEYQALKGLEGVRMVAVDGRLREVAVEVISLNYPAHEKSYQERLGFGGEAGERTAASTDRLLTEARAEMKDPSSQLSEHAKLKLGLLVQEVTEMLSGDIAEITDDPYRLNSRLMNVASLLGYVVHLNCRSGKDRTGIVEAETKFVAEALDVAATTGERSVVPDFRRPLTTDEQATVYQYAVHGGSVEVQLLNTGVPGSKMKPIRSKEVAGDPLPRRIGEDNWIVFKGLSFIAET